MSRSDRTRLERLATLMRVIDRKAVLDVESCSQSIREAQSTFDETSAVLNGESVAQQAFAAQCVSHLSAAKKAMQVLEGQRDQLQSTAIAARAQNRGVVRLLEAKEAEQRRAREDSELESALADLLQRAGASSR